ncbi:hypothetical protein CYMTET_25154 [Cymbomonas tetramitiformis]|uniref:Uncharacterized protein n=1 Tax=Cymbomonas tetramitiformis TaxID=36881 RepID=A0AAE0KZ83_9CHLO|nr:hypothetical protein CYMTET_25154 [Cymbomonas tetramitiformis]
MFLAVFGDIAKSISFSVQAHRTEANLLKRENFEDHSVERNSAPLQPAQLPDPVSLSTASCHAVCRNQSLLSASHPDVAFAAEILSRKLSKDRRSDGASQRETTILAASVSIIPVYKLRIKITDSAEVSEPDFSDFTEHEALVADLGGSLGFRVVEVLPAAGPPEYSLLADAALKEGAALAQSARHTLPAASAVARRSLGVEPGAALWWGYWRLWSVMWRFSRGMGDRGA